MENGTAINVHTSSGEVSMLDLVATMKPIMREQANAVFAELMGEGPKVQDLPAYQHSPIQGLPRIRAIEDRLGIIESVAKATDQFVNVKFNEIDMQLQTALK